MRLFSLILIQVCFCLANANDAFLHTTRNSFELFESTASDRFIPVPHANMLNDRIMSVHNLNNLTSFSRNVEGTRRHLLTIAAIEEHPRGPQYIASSESYRVYRENRQTVHNNAVKLIHQGTKDVTK